MSDIVVRRLRVLNAVSHFIGPDGKTYRRSFYPSTKTIHREIHGAQYDTKGHEKFPAYYIVLADLKALEKQGKVKRVSVRPAYWKRTDNS